MNEKILLEEFKHCEGNELEEDRVMEKINTLEKTEVLREFYKELCLTRTFKVLLIRAAIGYLYCMDKINSPEDMEDIEVKMMIDDLSCEDTEIRKAVIARLS